MKIDRDGTVPYQRKNRKTSGIVKLHVRSLRRDVRGMTYYWCSCQHGKQSQVTTYQTKALKDMAHPDTWCKECAAIVRNLAPLEKKT